MGEIVAGIRGSDDKAELHTRRGAGVDITASAPRYCVFDEVKEVYHYPADAPRKRRFESLIRDLRIQIRSKLPQKLDEGGTIPGREYYIQFRSGVFDTVKPEEIVCIETNAAYGVTIWDREARVLVAKAAKIRSAIEMAEQDPELLEALRVRFDMKDFVEPGEAPPQEEIRPVPFEGGVYTPRRGKKKE